MLVIGAGMLGPRPTQIIKEDASPVGGLVIEHCGAANGTRGVRYDIGFDRPETAALLTSQGVAISPAPIAIDMYRSRLAIDVTNNDGIAADIACLHQHWPRTLWQLGWYTCRA